MKMFICLISLSLVSICNARVCEDIKIIDGMLLVKMTDISETYFEFKYDFEEVKQTFEIQSKNNVILELKSYKLPCSIGNHKDITNVSKFLRIL